MAEDVSECAGIRWATLKVSHPLRSDLRLKALDLLAKASPACDTAHSSMLLVLVRHKLVEKIDWYREDDSRVFLSRNLIERLHVSQLNRLLLAG